MAQHGALAHMLLREKSEGDVTMAMKKSAAAWRM